MALPFIYVLRRQQLPAGNQPFWSFLIRQASAPDERMRRWKWKKCWRDGAVSALAATLGANIQIPLSARKWGITGKKVACRITPMLRCTAVTGLHRTKARKPQTINEFAIRREEGVAMHLRYIMETSWIEAYRNLHYLQHIAIWWTLDLCNGPQVMKILGANKEKPPVNPQSQSIRCRRN